MNEKRRIFLRVAYDGTNYCGWQVQANGITVQEVLNRHLSSLMGEEIRTAGASRTDSGVHARGNVAVFDTTARMPAERVVYALNTRLPEDIRIQESRQVPGEFHPRYTASVKTYEYKILNRKLPDPTRRLDSLFCYYALDRERMRAALPYIRGSHDFRSFQASGANHPERSTIREIYEADLLAEDDMIRFRVSGNGFLYNMVRILAGTLLEIGKGAIDPECMPAILEARSRAAAGPTAPPHGLTLMEIRYPEWGF